MTMVYKLIVSTQSILPSNLHEANEIQNAACQSQTLCNQREYDEISTRDTF